LVGKLRVLIGFEFVAESADCRWYQTPQFFLHLINEILNILAANDADNRLPGSALFARYFPDTVALNKLLLDALRLRCGYERAASYGRFWYRVVYGSECTRRIRKQFNLQSMLRFMGLVWVADFSRRNSSLGAGGHL
jgi:hypothetical protein